MKKIICIVLSLMMCFGIVGCGTMKLSEDDISNIAKEVVKKTTENSKKIKIENEKRLKEDLLVGKAELRKGEYSSRIVGTVQNVGKNVTIKFNTYKGNSRLDDVGKTISDLKPGEIWFYECYFDHEIADAFAFNSIDGQIEETTTGE